MDDRTAILAVAPVESLIRVVRNQRMILDGDLAQVATVLNSPRAVQMSLFVVRAFVKMREALAQHRELAGKLADLEKRLTERLDTHDKALVFILDELKQLREPAVNPKRREIGSHVRRQAGVLQEQPVPYRIRSRRRFRAKP